MDLAGICNTVGLLDTFLYRSNTHTNTHTEAGAQREERRYWFLFFFCLENLVQICGYQPMQSYIWYFTYWLVFYLFSSGLESELNTFIYCGMQCTSYKMLCNRQRMSSRHKIKIVVWPYKWKHCSWISFTQTEVQWLSNVLWSIYCT